MFYRIAEKETNGNQSTLQISEKKFPEVLIWSAFQYASNAEPVYQASEKNKMGVEL